MFLRRWSYTKSSLLARKPFLPAAKLSQQPRHGLPTTALSLAQNASTTTSEDNQEQILLGLSIQRVRSAKPWKIVETPLDAATPCRTEFPENDICFCASLELDIEAGQDIEQASIKNQHDDPYHNVVVWSTYSSSEAGHFRELQAESRAGAWAHLSPSRPLYRNLYERFQLPLGPQQISNLQKMVYYFKEHAVLTSEFGTKSHFSYDWMRALEFLQHEAQLEDSTSSVSPDRGSLTYYTFQPANRTPTSTSEIALPAEWTPLSFAAFVTQVTRMRPLSRDKRRNRNQSYLSVQAINACLRSLFEDPNMHQYLTVDAFNSALSFYYTHKRHSIHQVREMYSLMERLRMDTDPRTFVIMLMAAAKQQDLALLSYILVVMIGKGVKPTKKVWLTLLEVVQAKVARMHIIKHIREQGLLNDVVIVQAVVGLTLPPELPSHVQSNQNVESFFDLIDDRFGHDWPTVDIGNRMTWELCNKGLFSDVLRIWHLLHARECSPNAYTVTILLRHSKQIFDIGTSIEIIRHFSRLYGAGLDATGHETLFRHAWAMRSYNCCKAVWYHACTEELSHWKMNTMLFHSLTDWEERGLASESGSRSSMEEFHDSSDAWFRGAGKVIIEGNLSLFQSTVEQVEKSRETTSSFQSTMRWEDRWESEVARQMLLNKEELLAGKQLREDLVDALLRAYEVDSAWHKRQYWMQTTEWKVANAIPLPLVDRQAVRRLEERQIQHELSREQWFKERLRRRRKLRRVSRFFSSCILNRHRRSVLKQKDKKMLIRKRRSGPWRFRSLSLRSRLEKYRGIARAVRYRRWKPLQTNHVQLKPMDSTAQGRISRLKASSEHQLNYPLPPCPKVDANSIHKQFVPMFPMSDSILETHHRSNNLLVPRLYMKDGSKRSIHMRCIGNSLPLQEYQHAIETIVKDKSTAILESLGHQNDESHLQEPEGSTKDASCLLSTTFKNCPVFVATCPRSLVLFEPRSPLSKWSHRDLTRACATTKCMARLSIRKYSDGSFDPPNFRNSCKAVSDDKEKPFKLAQSVPIVRTVLRDRALVRRPRTLRIRREARKRRVAELEFLEWVNMSLNERSGYKPLRESEATTSSFKEAKIRVAIRELQTLDLSQPEDSNESQSSNFDKDPRSSIRNDVGAPNMQEGYVDIFDDEALIQKPLFDNGNGKPLEGYHGRRIVFDSEESGRLDMLPPFHSSDRTVDKPTFSNPTTLEPPDSFAYNPPSSHTDSQSTRPLIRKLSILSFEEVKVFKKWRKAARSQGRQMISSDPNLREYALIRSRSRQCTIEKLTSIRPPFSKSAPLEPVALTSKDTSSGDELQHSSSLIHKYTVLGAEELKVFRRHVKAARSQGHQAIIPYPDFFEHSDIHKPTESPKIEGPALSQSPSAEPVFFRLIALRNNAPASNTQLPDTIQANGKDIDSEERDVKVSKGRRRAVKNHEQGKRLFIRKHKVAAPFIVKVKTR